MRLRGIGRLRRAAKRLKKKFERKALILMYHRVDRSGSDPWRLCVAPERFAEHLYVLRKRFRPARLPQLVRGLEGGSIARRSVVVTFDDGYADNLYNAKPLLEHYDVPATVFVASGSIGSGREFWWDELERLLLNPGTLPQTLAMSVRGKEYVWTLGDASRYDEDASQRHRNWRAWGEPDPTYRHKLYRSVYELLHPLPEQERLPLQDELLAWAGLGPAGRPGHRPLSSDEVLALARDGLVEIGAHTITHALLSSAPALSQRDEIYKSKAHLEEIVGRPVTSFAYPYGRPCDYTAETVALVRQGGYRSACSNFPGAVDRASDPFQMPRIHVQDWDGEEFDRQLSRWFEG